MATKRMFSKDISEEDRFVDMTTVSRLLYFYLMLNADDDGFVGKVKMINFLTGATQDNYDELLKNGMILQPSKNKVYVITDWYNQNKVEDKIYKQTTYLSIRSLLFLKTDFSYTTDLTDEDIMAPADLWIKNGRDKKTLPSTQQQKYQKYLKSLNNSVLNTSSKLLGNNKETSSKLLGQIRSDQSRVDQVREEKARSDKDQQRAEQATNYKYRNSSSNGGLGEILLDHQTSTSSLVNNATRENREDSRVTSGVNSTESLDSKGVNSSKQSNSQSSKHDGSKLDPDLSQSNDNNEAIPYLFDSVNSAFNSDIPYDDERLKVLFDDLLNQYKEDYIQDGIIELADSNAIQQTNSSVKSLLVNHLATTIKQQLTD